MSFNKDKNFISNSLKIINDKISNTDIKMALMDIERFIQNPSELNIWSKQYFHDLAQMIKYE